MLLTTNKTISQISDALGFSNASTYSKLFKNYLSVTPNEYRTMKNMINIMVVQMKRCQKTKKAIKKLIRSVIPNDVSDIYDEIRIDNSQIVNASPFYSVIQIHTIEEMKLLFLEGLYQKMGYEGSNIIFYFMPYLYEYGKLLTQNEKIILAKLLLKMIYI